MGRLEPAEAMIDGLTVICGNNNTGKSTVGKVLNSIFSAFHDIEDNFRREKEQSILRYIRTHLLDPSARSTRYHSYTLVDLLDADPKSAKAVRRV